MRVPLRVPPDSMTESEVVRNVLPRDRTSAVTALFEAHYASLCGWLGCWWTTVRQPRTW